MSDACFPKLTGNWGIGMWTKISQSDAHALAFGSLASNTNKQGQEEFFLAVHTAILNFRRVSHVHSSRDDGGGQATAPSAKWLWRHAFSVRRTWFWHCPHSVGFRVPSLLAGPVLQPSWQFCELPTSLSILPFLLGLAKLSFHCWQVKILADTSDFWNGRKDQRNCRKTSKRVPQHSENRRWNMIHSCHDAHEEGQSLDQVYRTRARKEPSPS